MTLQIQDRVKETTTTTGTGAVSLAGAITGFRAFSSVCADQDTVWYAIQAVDSNGVPTGDWETGVGTYTVSGNTLTRTTILASSNSNAAVNLSAGTKQVWIGQPAGRVVRYPTFGEADTTPNLSAFTWTNQGVATATQREGYFSVVTTDSPSGDSLKLLTIAAPGTPYTVTARIVGLLSLNYHGYGLCMLDTVSGQIMTHGTTGAGFHVSRWTSPTAYASSAFTGTSLQPAWLRVRDDGTNIYADMSSDGYSFINVWSNARGTYLPAAPNRVGIYLHNNSAPAQCSLYSWKVG